MKKMISMFNKKSALLVSFLALCLLSTSSFASSGATLQTMAESGTSMVPSIAKFFTAVFFLLAVFAGGMFGWKIYQHGKDAREHKLSTAFIYLLAAGCLIGAGFFVSTMANTLGATSTVTSSGDYSSFGNG